jgi:hypothetical protein
VLNEVTAIRWATPLREGGSLPGPVEADDLAGYVMKSSGAAQGRDTLVAEASSGRLARLLGPRVPGLAAIRLDPCGAWASPAPRCRSSSSRRRARPGLDFLAGAFGFDALADAVDPVEAGRMLWFDALVGNVDRSWHPACSSGTATSCFDHGATLIAALHRRPAGPGASGLTAHPAAEADRLLDLLVK